jgi:hypothetical protein
MTYFCADRQFHTSQYSAIFGKMLAEICYIIQLNSSLLDIHFHQIKNIIYQKRMIKKVPYGISRTFQHKLHLKCMVWMKMPASQKITGRLCKYVLHAIIVNSVSCFWMNWSILLLKPSPLLIFEFNSIQFISLSTDPLQVQRPHGYSSQSTFDLYWVILLTVKKQNVWSLTN